MAFPARRSGSARGEPGAQSARAGIPKSVRSGFRRRGRLDPTIESDVSVPGLQADAVSFALADFSPLAPLPSVVASREQGL